MTAASIAVSPEKHAPSRWTSAAGLLAAAVVLCACRTSTGVFANLAAAQTESQDACKAGEGAGVGGPIPPAALVMLVEATKLLISVVLWNLEERRPQPEQLPGPGPGGSPLAAAASGPLPLAEPLLDRRFFLFAPPAALYCSCNVLWLIALQRMAAPVFEMLSTLRIVLSVALAWAFTQSGAQLRAHHYAALGMLVAANLVAHWGMGGGAAPRALDVLLVMLSISSSAVANMLFELLTKERFLAVSLHLQNIQLYTWGVAFNAATFAAMQRGGGGAAAVLSLAWLPCANVWHVLLILVFACVGIVTGIVLKYHGNVASVVAQSFAVHLSALLSHMSIRFTPSWQFLAGAALCQAAILLYNRDSLWPRKA